VSGLLVLAAVLAALLGAAHSWLGERYILARLFRRADLPHLFGSDVFTKRTLRFAWHVTTLAWWGIAGILVLAWAGGPADVRIGGVLEMIALTALMSALIGLIWTRGRHPAWIVFVAIGAATWIGANAPRDGVGDAPAAVSNPEPPRTGIRTRVVMLGSGTPNADPDRSGPALAIVVDDRAYIVDAGPGVVRRAAAAAGNGVSALGASRLNRVFLTHLHSDHTVGLPDLILSPWVLDRPDALEVYGPAGTADMVAHIEQAWARDIDIRTNGGEPRGANRDAWKSIVHEVAAGLVYEDANVRVTAIPVHHGTWPEAFGYRFETADRVIVVSGDAAPTDALVEACNGCDVLVHEVYSETKFADRPADWQAYHSRFHTSTRELAALATRARPKLLVLHHGLFWGATPDEMLAEIRAAGYEGDVVTAADLGEY
jgi:ribonuclease BN (tRNA processing enzyme)